MLPDHITTIFWIDCPSLTHMSLIDAWSHANSGRVLVVADRPMPHFRASLGWKASYCEATEIAIAPSVKQICRILAKAGPHVLHFFFGSAAYRTARRAFALSRRKRCQRLFVSEANQDYRLLGKLAFVRHWVWHRRIRMEMGAVLGLGKVGVEWFKRCGYPAENIFEWGHFLPGISPPGPAIPARKNGKTIRLLFMGRLVWRKGLDVLFRALHEVAQASLVLDIFGCGAQELALRRLCESMGLSERVTFNHPLPNEQVRTIMARSDFLVLPSRFDGWGLVVNEALSVGTRVLVSSNCGASSLVVSENQGQVFPADDPHALAEILGGILAPTDEERRRLDLMSWAECLSPTSGIEYLESIYQYAFCGGPRPDPPWLRTTHECWRGITAGSGQPAPVAVSVAATKRPRVVIVDPGEPSGTTAQKASALSRHGIDLHLVYWERKGGAFSHPLSCDLPSTNVHRITLPPGAAWWQKAVQRLLVLYSIRKCLRHLKPDVVDVPTPDFLAAAVCPTRVARAAVFDMRYTRDWMRRLVLSSLVRWLFRRVDLFVVTSPQYESEFLRRHRLVPSQVSVACLPNSAPTQLFKGYRPRPRDGKLVVSYIGTFRGASAIRAMAEGVARACALGVKAQGLFAGCGPDLPCIEALCARLKCLACSGPYHYAQDIMNLYEQADVVYAVYDDSEDKRIHIACRLAEAVVCGLPIIVMEGTYMAEIVREKGLGFVVPLGDAQAVAEVLCRLAREPALREKIASNCSAVAHTFCFEHHVQDYLQAYDRLVRSTLR